MAYYCCICGVKLKFFGDNEYYDSTVVPALRKLLEENNVNRRPYYFPKFCKDCMGILTEMLENAAKGDITKANLAENDVWRIYLNNTQNKDEFIEDNFKLFLEQAKNEAINLSKKGNLISDARSLLSNRWEILQNKYSNLVFPSLEEHRHICATKSENNFILIENGTPKLKITPNDELSYCQETYEQICKSDERTLFAVSVIPLENIVSYQLVGNIEHTTVTNGGGPTVPNIKGAVYGGLLFGAAGALIGAQTGAFTNPIKSEVVEHDSRRTMLTLKNAEGQVEIRELPYYYSEVFMKVIPEKEFNYLQATKNAETTIHTQSAPAINMVEEMKQLKELFDLNLITQEEFDSKRQQILKL